MSTPATALRELFDRTAAEYDAERRLLVPPFDAFYGAALSEVSALPQGAHVLDLGAGTGLFAALLAAARPDLQFTLTDVAEAMLAQAQTRFARLGVPAPQIVVQDHRDALPAGPFAAVISALSIHHLEHADKRDLFARIRDRLPPGGLFVNAEQMAGNTAAEDGAQDQAREREARALGADDEMIARARMRMAHDRCATAADQLRWLRDAGFAEASSPWREGRFAVIAARR